MEPETPSSRDQPSQSSNPPNSQNDPPTHSRYLLIPAHQAPQRPGGTRPRTDYGTSSLPTGGQPLASRGLGPHALTITNSLTERCLSDLMYRGPIPSYLRKPNCSYNSLIAMAILASGEDSMPVSEVYKYIEQEFPYFVTSAPDGWKNSVRHSLSLGQYFRKVEKTPSNGWHGKKGFHWEIVPGKKETLRMEVEKFLREEGRGLVENRTATAGLASGKVQGTQTRCHQPISTSLNFRSAATPHRLLTTQTGVYPSTGQLTTSPSTRVILTNVSSTVSAPSEVGGSTNTTRTSTSTHSSECGPGIATCSSAKDKTVAPSLLAQVLSAYTAPSKFCEDLTRIALSGLSPSRLRIDPNLLEQLGMDTTTSTTAFVDSLLSKQVGAEGQGGFKVDTETSELPGMGSMSHSSTNTSPRLCPSSTGIERNAARQIPVALTSKGKRYSAELKSVQSESAGGGAGVSTVNQPLLHSEEEISSPFIAMPQPTEEATLNEVVHGSTSAFHAGYSKSYYKAFWKPGQSTALHGLHKQQKTSLPVKRTQVDEEFMAAITPYFADEVYRLGNIDGQVTPRLEEKRESKSDSKVIWSGPGQKSEEPEHASLPTSTRGKKRPDAQENTNDGLQLTVCIPLESVEVKQHSGCILTSSRKRSRYHNTTYPQPQGKRFRASSTADDNLTADEFFASIFGKGGHSEPGSVQSGRSNPLPLPLTANDNTMAGKGFCEREEEFVRMLSSSEVEEAYQCFQSGSSTSCKTDWFLLTNELTSLPM